MRREVFSYLKIAANVARGGTKRNFIHGAVGIRSDGAMVTAMNSKTLTPNKAAHAEFRLTNRLDAGSVVYVARINVDGEFMNSKPCKSCVNKMRNKRVKRVYYTISKNEYGIMDL